MIMVTVPLIGGYAGPEHLPEKMEAAKCSLCGSAKHRIGHGRCMKRGRMAPVPTDLATASEHSFHR